jgi:DNA topoisomerase-1
MPRLHRVTRDDLTIERRRNGSGHVFVDTSGHAIRSAELRSRVRALGIPPAWVMVQIAPDPLAQMQACGTDAAGRVQYIYHPEWEARRARRKQMQLTALSKALPRIRRRVSCDLEAEAGCKALALGIGVALIDRTAMRVGRERYLDAHGTRGAGTLYTRDVKIAGEKVRISFPAKNGKRATYVVADARLVDAIRRIKTIAGRRLLMYRNGADEPRALHTDDLNAYLRSLAGSRVTTKDFRTLHASALAAEALAKLEPGPSAAARKRQIGGVARQVAGFLQNTPAIARQSYIAPCLFDLFEAGKLATLWQRETAARDGLRQRELRLGAVLRAAG